MEPQTVVDALARARSAGFVMSSAPDVGRLLGVLAAAVPPNGRILELGTGCGVGLAWIVDGLGGRVDVEVVSVESDPDVAPVALSGRWPTFVTVVIGDALDALADRGTFDLVFADAEGGKWEGLDRTIAALRPGGHLLVDDMTPTAGRDDHHRVKTEEVRTRLTTDPHLVSVEIAWATGIILCTARAVPAG